MNIARSAVKLFAANAGRAVVMFVGITLFARVLGASDLGIYFLFQAVLGMLMLPANLGILGAIEKRISEGVDRPAYLTTGALLNGVAIAVLVVVIVLAREPIDDYVGAAVALFLAVAVVLRTAAWLTMKVLQGELRVGETAIIRFSQQVVWVAAGGVLLYVGFGLYGLIYALLLSYVVMLAMGFAKRETRFGQPSIRHARSLFEYAKYNFVSSVGGYAYGWIDVLVIGLFLTSAHVAAYEVAWRVTTLFLLFGNAIATTILPQISEWNASDDTDRIERLLPRVIPAALLFVVPSFFGAVLFAEEILALLFGPEFALAAVALVVLSFEKILQSVHVVLGRSLQGVDRPDLAARATVAAVVVNVALNFALVPPFGLPGAAVATTLSFVLNAGLHAMYLRRFVAIRIPYRDLGWILLSSLGMVVVLRVVQRAVAVDTLPRLFGVVLFGALVYGVVLLAYRPFRTEAVSRVRNAVRAL